MKSSLGLFPPQKLVQKLSVTLGLVQFELNVLGALCKMNIVACPVHCIFLLETLLFTMKCLQPIHRLGWLLGTSWTL